MYINQDLVNGPWGGGNAWLGAMHQYCNIDVQPQRNSKILISSLDGTLSAEKLITIKHKFNCDLYLRVNDCDARKNTINVDNCLIELSKYIDGTIFVSKWLKKYFEIKHWNCHNNIVIHNGVDSNIFKKNEKFNNGKINLVTHHWSNNPMKGFDIYRELDDWIQQYTNYTFTYIGRSCIQFKNSKIISPLCGNALGDELGKYDVYISASRFDPGPNHILESLSCNIPTYVHSNGGGCVEFAGFNHTYNTFKELQTILLNKQFDYNHYTKLNNWYDCIQSYKKFMNL